MIFNIKWYLYYICIFLLKNKKSKKPLESCDVYSNTNGLTTMRKISYKKQNIPNSKYYFKKINKFMGMHYYFYQIKNDQNKFLSIDSTILFFDRIDLASDNAYTLYNLMNDYKNKYFIIDFNSSDYNRLKDQGINLIDYGSDLFKELYLNCDYIFSSSFDTEITNFRGLRNKAKHRFVFLQHGVVDNDLNYYFVDCNFDYIICSNDFEKNLLLKKHMFFENQLITTGLPRFLNLKNVSDKYVVLSYTWRGYLRDKDLKVDLNLLNKSLYLKMFDDVVYNFPLSTYMKKHNLELVIMLHPQFKELIPFFKSRYQTKIISDYDYTYYINNAHLLITDYSSVFNDFSYINKPVYFYQKDENEFFKKHIVKKLVDYNELNGTVITDINHIKNEVKKVNQYYNFDLKNFIKYINKKSV